MTDTIETPTAHDDHGADVHHGPSDKQFVAIFFILAAITAVDGGRANFRIEDGSANLPGPVAHLIADVFGYFT